MSRRTRLGLTLGIAVPICLLALAALADRLFHHGSAPPPRPQAHAVPPAPDEAEQARQAQSDLMDRILRECSGPEGVDDCAPRKLAASFARELPVLQANRDQLERVWIAELSSGNHAAAYGLALLRSQRALPTLRARLLAERYFYGWETSTPDVPGILFADEQYPHHQAIIAAIEWIDGRPIREAVRLTRGERRLLRQDVAGCDGGAAARWLLHKLDGASLPRAAANRAQRIRCDGPSTDY